MLVQNDERVFVDFGFYVAQRMQADINRQEREREREIGRNKAWKEVMRWHLCGSTHIGLMLLALDKIIVWSACISFSVLIV